LTVTTTVYHGSLITCSAAWLFSQVPGQWGSSHWDLSRREAEG